MKIFNLFLVILMTSKNLYSYTGKGIKTEIKGFEKFNIEGMGNNLRIISEDFNILINLNEKIDQTKVTFIHNKEKYYISVTKSEIDSLSSIKNLFSEKRKEKNYNLKLTDENKSICKYPSKCYIYEDKDLKIKSFFSLEMLEHIRKYFNYNLFAELISNTDFSIIPMIDEHYDLIKFFVTQSKEKGFISNLFINNVEVYSIDSLKEIDKFFSEEELINKGFKKRGLDHFLRNVM